MDVDEPTGKLAVVESHRLVGDVEIEAVARNEVVDGVELALCAPVKRYDTAVLHVQPGLGVVWTVHCDEPQLGMRRDQKLATQLALLSLDEAPRPRSLLFAHWAKRRFRSA